MIYKESSDYLSAHYVCSGESWIGESCFTKTFTMEFALCSLLPMLHEAGSKELNVCCIYKLINPNKFISAPDFSKFSFAVLQMSCCKLYYNALAS